MELFNFSFFSITGQALLWYWIVCLGNKFLNVMKRSYTTRPGGKVMAKGLSETLEKWGTLGTVMANTQSLGWVQSPLLLSPSSSLPLQFQSSIKLFKIYIYKLKIRASPILSLSRMKTGGPRSGFGAMWDLREKEELVWYTQRWWR